MTSSVQNSTASAAATSTAASTASSQLATTQNDFLSLLTTQLQNQDPLNPMDNAQVTSQMAQLSMVTGINQLNTTVQALSTSLSTSQSLQAAALVGATALVPGNQIPVVSGQTSAGAVNLTQAEDKVTVTISNSSGTVVKTLQLGSQSTAGVVNFQWDGTDNTGAAVVAGNYTFTATAVQGTTSSSPATLSYGTVDGVSLTSNGATLNMGALGNVALSAVQQFL